MANDFNRRYRISDGDMKLIETLLGIHESRLADAGQTTAAIKVYALKLRLAAIRRRKIEAEA